MPKWFAMLTQVSLAFALYCAGVSVGTGVEMWICGVADGVWDGGAVAKRWVRVIAGSEVGVKTGSCWVSLHAVIKTLIHNENTSGRQPQYRIPSYPSLSQMAGIIPHYS